MPGPLYVKSAKPKVVPPPVMDNVLQTPRVAPVKYRRVTPEQVVSKGVSMKKPTGKLTRITSPFEIGLVVLKVTVA